MSRFCPQCGDRVSFSSTAKTQKDRKVDAEGFCMPKGTRGVNVNGRGRSWRSAEDTEERPRPGCAEHLRRFDAETGARIDAPSLSRAVDPWIITTT